MEVLLGNIPPQMRSERRWVCWQVQLRGTSKTKVPIAPFHRSDGRLGKAKSNDPETWGTFADACALRLALPEDDLGIGFMLGDGWSGLDLDHVVDEGGNLIPEAFQIIADLGGCGYAEWSPSGEQTRWLHLKKIHS